MSFTSFLVFFLLSFSILTHGKPNIERELESIIKFKENRALHEATMLLNKHFNANIVLQKPIEESLSRFFSSRLDWRLVGSVNLFAAQNTSFPLLRRGEAALRCVTAFSRLNDSHSIKPCLKIAESASKTDEYFLKTFLHTNAYVLGRKNQLDLAIKELESEIKLSTKLKDDSASRLIPYLQIAELYILKDDLKTAMSYIDKADRKITKDTFRYAPFFASTLRLRMCIMEKNKDNCLKKLMPLYQSFAEEFTSDVEHINLLKYLDAIIFEYAAKGSFDSKEILKLHQTHQTAWNNNPYWRFIKSVIDTLEKKDGKDFKKLKDQCITIMGHGDSLCPTLSSLK